MTLKNFSQLNLKYFLLISLIALSISLLSLIKFGLNLSIDFTGGTTWEVEFEKAGELEKPTELFSRIGLSDVGWSQIGTVVRMDLPFLENSKKIELASLLEREYSKFSELKYESIGPLLGRELITKTMVAIVLVSFSILAYLIHQFKDINYGLSAVLAMLHDSLILLGAFSLLGRFFYLEIDILFVTALLTTLSFSVHDTIVVLDRIRELKKNNHAQKVKNLAIIALSQTITRSLNNSLTIILMLSAILILSSQTLQNFSLALLIGAITGTYSSSFVAVPLLIVFEDFNDFIKQKR